MQNGAYDALIVIDVQTALVEAHPSDEERFIASVGALIEEAGLKGLRIGGAQVSEVHANFIVNTGDATARDVLELINLVKTKVYETYGIELQPEVRFLGFA